MKNDALLQGSILFRNIQQMLICIFTNGNIMKITKTCDFQFTPRLNEELSVRSTAFSIIEDTRDARAASTTIANVTIQKKRRLEEIIHVISAKMTVNNSKPIIK